MTLMLVHANDAERDALVLAGEPLFVAGCLAMLHPAAGRTGALILEPFGYEDGALHASLRRLAAMIARQGVPVMRLDAPGSGHSLDPPHGADGVAAWRDAARAAAQEFMALAGLERLVIIGVSSSALVAAPLAVEVGAAGLVLIAPWLDGRRALRELEVSSRLMLDALEVRPDPDGEPGEIVTGGFVLPAATRAALSKMKIAAPDLAGLPAILLAARPAQQAVLAELAAAIGPQAGAISVPGYDEAAFDAMAEPVSEAALEPVAAWIASRAGPAAPAMAAPRALPASPARGEGFVEEALRFGPSGRLFGVLCRPVSGSTRAAMLLLSAGRSRSVGWARADVLEARRLALTGVASLRFDAAGLGDSLSDEGREPLYDETRSADVSAALDVLQQRGLGPVGMHGRCSGAFLGFAALARDRRIAAAVLCNAQRYVWRPGETVEQAMRQSVRAIGPISGQLADGKQWGRLLRGEITPRAAVARIVNALRSRLEARLTRRGVALSAQARLTLGVRARFAGFAERRLPLRILISEGDRALDEFRSFLPDDADIAALGNLTLTMIPDADHNMTPRAARRIVSREIDAMIAEMLQAKGTAAEPSARTSPAA